MNWFTRLFGRLFGRKAGRASASPLDLGPAPAADTPAPSTPSAVEPPPEAAAVPPPIPDPEGLAVVEVEADEDGFEEEERAEVSPLSAEADLDRRPDLDVIVAERQARVEGLREQATRDGLAGEQRVRLTDPAGPGTLAEALARLEQEGKVTSRIGEDEDGAPVLIYTPVADA